MGQTIGIDFGTTNTVVSYQNKKGKIVCLRDVNNNKSIPTALYFKSENDYVIGEEALSLAEAENVEPIVSFKSHLDEKFRYDVIAANGDRFRLGAKKAVKYFIERIITSVQDRIIKTFGPVDGCIDKAIITVPAKFSHNAKEKIREAAIDAGLSQVELIYEPTAAAAAAYRTIEDTADKSTMLVYDFGGGTFDISIVRAEKKNNHIRYEQLYTSGQKELGGNDITFLIACDILEAVNEEFDFDMSLDEDVKGLYKIYDRDDYDGDLPYDIYRENAKKIIQAAERVKIDFDAGSETFNIKMADGSIELFTYDYKESYIKQIIFPLVKKTVSITNDSLEWAKENDCVPDRIVLAGGSANIPMVHEELSKLMELAIEELDGVTELISKGAVILNENKMNEISSITSCSYGIIVKENNILDKFEPIIPINTHLPAKAERVCYLNMDGQQNLEIKLYEHDIQNYPKAKRAIDEGIEIDQIYEIALPDGLKRADTELKLAFVFAANGTVSIDVDICSLGEVIAKSQAVINIDSDME